MPRMSSPRRRARTLIALLSATLVSLAAPAVSQAAPAVHANHVRPVSRPRPALGRTDPYTRNVSAIAG
jgi:hypothetical protein